MKRKTCFNKYFRVFGSKCFIKLNDDSPGKFDSRVDEGIFLGYSTRSKAYKCYNYHLRRIVESIDVNIDEYLPEKRIEDHEVEPFFEQSEEEEPEKEEENEEPQSEPQNESSQTPSKINFVQRYHPEE